MTELDTLAFLMLACNQSGSLSYLEYVRTKTPKRKSLVLYTLNDSGLSRRLFTFII